MSARDRSARIAELGVAEDRQPAGVEALMDFAASRLAAAAKQPLGSLGESASSLANMEVSLRVSLRRVEYWILAPCSGNMQSHSVAGRVSASSVWWYQQVDPCVRQAVGTILDPVDARL